MTNTKKTPLKKRIAYTIAGVLFVFIFLPLFTLWGFLGFERDILKIDACLDAGGRWDYELRECDRPETQAFHPLVPPRP